MTDFCSDYVTDYSQNLNYNLSSIFWRWSLLCYYEFHKHLDIFTNLILNESIIHFFLLENCFGQNKNFFFVLLSLVLTFQIIFSETRSDLVFLIQLKLLKQLIYASLKNISIFFLLKPSGPSAYWLKNHLSDCFQVQKYEENEIKSVESSYNKLVQNLS